MGVRAKGVRIHNPEQTMKQRRQTAVIQAIGKQTQAVQKTSRSAPIPLSEKVLTQVTGGVKPVVTATPQHNW
jgi:hypothetical protein